MMGHGKMKRFTNLYSAAVSGTGNNNGIVLQGGKEYLFKSFYRLRADGENRFKLFFSNSVDTTGNCRAEKLGDGYEIAEAYAAFSKDKSDESGRVKITFDGKDGKKVEPGEVYESDFFDFTYKKDGYLVLAFTVKTAGRTFLPATDESVTTGKMFEGNKEIPCGNFVLRPAFIGIDKPFKKTVGFWGDSITQGTRTGIDKYEAWTHKIGFSLDDDISFWNLGMGWARGYDASLGGVFTKKAAMCDEVFVCFGVNDIRSGGRSAEDVTEDLKKAKELLEKANSEIKVRFLTVPPFDMSVYEEKQRKKVNEYIRSTKEYFDIASCLEKDEDGNVKDCFKVSNDDSHPNADAGDAIFDAFMLWREKYKW